MRQAARPEGRAMCIAELRRLSASSRRLHPSKKKRSIALLESLLAALGTGADKAQAAELTEIATCKWLARKEEEEAAEAAAAVEKLRSKLRGSAEVFTPAAQLAEEAARKEEEAAVAAGSAAAGAAEEDEDDDDDEEEAEDEYHDTVELEDEPDAEEEEEAGAEEAGGTYAGLSELEEKVPAILGRRWCSSTSTRRPP